MTMNNLKTGFINVLKPPGMTSFAVVNWLKKKLNTKKVGHAGTLDPACAGVLPVAVGSSTKLLEYLDGKKGYVAEMIVGTATTTGDYTGDVVKASDNIPATATLLAALPKFKGKIMQRPPAYSALKVNGQKAYDLARSGKAVDLAERQVEVTKLELRELTARKYQLEVECSAGTYIRKLIEDLGEATGTVATMGFLLRYLASGFNLNSSRTLEEITAAIANGDFSFIENPCKYLNLPTYELPNNRQKPFQNGLSSYLKDKLPNGEYLVLTNGVLLGVGTVKEQSLYPSKVLAN